MKKFVTARTLCDSGQVMHGTCLNQFYGGPVSVIESVHTQQLNHPKMSLIENWFTIVWSTVAPTTTGRNEHLVRHASYWTSSGEGRRTHASMLLGSQGLVLRKVTIQTKQSKGAPWCKSANKREKKPCSVEVQLCTWAATCSSLGKVMGRISECLVLTYNTEAIRNNTWFSRNAYELGWQACTSARLRFKLDLSYSKCCVSVPWRACLPTRFYSVHTKAWKLGSVGYVFWPWACAEICPHTFLGMLLHVCSSPC